MLPCLSVPSKRCGRCVVSSACFPVRAQEYGAGGLLCLNEMVLDIFTTPPTRHSSSVLAPRPFFFLTTEGKQMRRNVNSRLLTQHCADKKNRAPAAFARYPLSTLLVRWTDGQTDNLCSTEAKSRDRRLCRRRDQSSTPFTPVIHGSFERPSLGTQRGPPPTLLLLSLGERSG